MTNYHHLWNSENNQHSFKYNVKDVVAESSPDTSIVWIFLSFIISLFLFNQEKHYFFTEII